MRPHYNHSSRENATPSSGTSPLASCKGVTPPPGTNIIPRGSVGLTILEFFASYTNQLLFHIFLKHLKNYPMIAVLALGLAAIK